MTVFKCADSQNMLKASQRGGKRRSSLKVAFRFLFCQRTSEGIATQVWEGRKKPQEPYT